MTKPKTEAGIRLPDLLRTFRRPADATTAADLRASLVDAEEQHRARLATLAELQAAHADMLLGDDAAAVVQHEAAMVKAREEVSRAAVVIPALEARIAAAEQREALAKLEADAAEGETIARDVATAVQSYERAARDLLALHARINEGATKVSSLNAAFNKAGRPDLHIAPPMLRIWPHAAGHRLGGISIPGARRSCGNVEQFDRDAAGAEARRA